MGWIRDPGSSKDDRLYRCSGSVFMARMMEQKDSPSWDFTWRQATAMSDLLSEKKSSNGENRDDETLSFDSIPLYCRVLIGNVISVSLNLFWTVSS